MDDMLFGNKGDKAPSDLIDLLDVSIREPVIDKILSRATTYDDYIRFVPTDPSYRAKLIKELDNEWAPWMNTGMTATGKVQLFSNGLVDTERHSIADAQVVSNGFNIITYDDEDGNTLGRVAYDMYVTRNQLGGDDDSLVHVLAQIDEVVLETNKASSERANAWVELTAPEFITEINRRIINSRSATEAIMALKGFDLEACINTRDELTRNSAEAYINSLIQIDTLEGYDLNIRGRVYALTVKNELQPIELKLHSVAKLKTIEVGQGITNEGRTKWELMFPATLIPEELSEPTPEYSLPINSIRSISSLRQLAYNHGKPPKRPHPTL